jgi:phage shock protein PspC (stress-responsive transcriptional regulator)
MSLSDELSSLDELHQRGTLSDDEFARAKARVLGSAPRAAGDGPALAAAVNSFRRHPADRWLGGVCGGLAHITGLASWIWRLVFTLLALCGGTGVLVYLLMWIFVPLDDTHFNGEPDKLRAG